MAEKRISVLPANAVLAIDDQVVVLDASAATALKTTRMTVSDLISGLVGLGIHPTIASQAEAVAGVDNIKMMTPLRTNQAVAIAVAALIAAAPGVLNTLDELAAALGDDANFAATVTTSLGNRVRVDAAQAFSAPQMAQARSNLGLGDMALETAANYLTKAGNLSGLADVPAARANLGLTIGTSGATVPLLSTANTWAAMQSIVGAAAALRLRDTDGVGYWDMSCAHFDWSGVSNQTWGLQYNEDGAATDHPKWGENIEPRYVDGAPPLGLLEKNWSYTSIDRLTAYRPFMFNVNLNTHLADFKFICGTLSVIGNGQSQGADDALNIDTANKTLRTNRLRVGSIGSAPFVLTVNGALGSASALANITATDAATADVLLQFGSNAVTGQLNVLSAELSASDRLQTVLRNTGAGGAHHLVWAGGSGDAWIRMLAATDWAFGNDRSDSGKFKISNNGDIGTNDRLTISTGGEVTITTAAGLVLSSTSSPASGAAGTAGAITWDANYIYVCTATGAWKRAALTGGY